jgi:predicted restriction endonuclease
MTEPALIGLAEGTLARDEDAQTTADPVILVEWEDSLQARIAASSTIPETARKALIQARRGQGRFKENVIRIEPRCRITGVDNPTHLIASHIKPWRESSDEERLVGGNGLLLTPSIDHLFDRGFITFDDNGEVLLSPIADPESLPRMGVRMDQPLLTGGFNSDQRHFLDYHRTEIFLKSAT